MTTNSLNIKQFPVWVVNIRVQMLCFSYVAYLFPIIVREICLLTILKNYYCYLDSWEILVGWAKGCCVHVFHLEAWPSGQSVCSRIAAVTQEPRIVYLEILFNASLNQRAFHVYLDHPCSDLVSLVEQMIFRFSYQRNQSFGHLKFK